MHNDRNHFNSDNATSSALNLPDIVLSERTDTTDTEVSAQSKNRIDRSHHKYSEDDFLALPRMEQLALANVYWMDSRGFDPSKMFQFSYTHFAELCQRLGFKKGVLDTHEDDVTAEADTKTIYIDHGRRPDTKEKKITLSGETLSLMDALFLSNASPLSNVEQSKILDAILHTTLMELVALKDAGRFKVAYRPRAEEQIL